MAAFFGPAISAYLPRIVGDESQLGPANTLWATLDNVAFIIEPGVAGLLIAAGGEIGLLRNGRRTATVTSQEAGRLWALDREPFVSLVQAGPGLSTRLMDLYRGAAARTS